MVEFNGETITYDAIGNPLSYYGGRSFTWEGRELKTLTNGDTIASYVYNESGIRTSKTVDGVTTNYLLEGSRIIFQTVGSTRWSFLYYGDELTGFEVEGETYYYLKNLQGDIFQIVDEDGEIVVEYLYDDWGKLLSIEGELSDTLGEENPFRYRGYYYDSETGLYYVSSRYYDPEVGRFISPDTTDVLTATPGALTDKNLYAYCDNNPIMREDKGGRFWNTIIGAVAGAVVGGITAAIMGTDIKAGIVSGAISGAITGVAVDAAIAFSAAGLGALVIVSVASGIGNAAASYTNQRMNGVSHSDVDKGAIIIDGLWGAVSGALSLGTAGVGSSACQTFKQILAQPIKKIVKQAVSDFVMSVTISFGTWLNGTKMNSVRKQ